MDWRVYTGEKIAADFGAGQAVKRVKALHQVTSTCQPSPVFRTLPTRWTRRTTYR